jgi:hypothetical protein
MLSAIITCHAQTAKTTKNTKTEGEKIEIYYFHFTKRCATCNAVENETKSVLKTQYASELKNNKIVFTSLNLDEKADKKIAKKLKISGQALLVVQGDNQINLTNDGFMNARTNPEKFHTILKGKIDELI